VISGVELLLYQGIEQLRIVTEENFNTEKLASNLREKLATAL
jgi:shikimate 5-dehydrogenase